MKSCCVCNSENWQYLDDLRDKQYWIDRDILDYKNPHIGFKICRGCGYVTYDARPDLEEHYRGPYRKSLQAGNFLFTNVKLEYHRHFLKDILSKSYPGIYKILDYGCAHGQALKAVTSWFGEDNAKGYELTESYANFGRNYYGLDISTEKELNEPDKTYDLIICFHTLEHLPNPVGSLKKLATCLKDDGRIYLSVPVWFECLDEAPIGGSITADFENLYHINHIQTFSRNSIRNVISLAGLAIETEDDQVYGHTFILKKLRAKSEIKKDDPDKIVSIIRAQKKAIEHFQKHEFKEAFEAYSDYPDAILHYGLKTFQQEFEGQRATYETALETCSLKAKPVQQLAQLYMQWDGLKSGQKKAYTNSIKKAEEYFEKLLELRPGNEVSLMQLGLIEADYKNNPRKAIEYWERVLEINPTKYVEVHGFIGALMTRDFS